MRDTGIETIAAWDILFPAGGGREAQAGGRDRSARGLRRSAADAVRGSDIIISAVTAASSLEAARSVEPHLSGNPYFLDINSVSPGRKQETETLLGAKARYVDVAILAPIHPARHQTPMLLAGPHAETVMPLLIDELDMRGAIAGDEVGAAAALKMIRSVMIKGIEALTLECFLAAKRAGIVDEVAASLKNNYPTLDWNQVIEYNIERMASHGVRRADEMDQVAETLRELGIDPLMATATVDAPARDGADRQGAGGARHLEGGPRRDARRHQHRRQGPALSARPAPPAGRESAPACENFTRP